MQSAVVAFFLAALLCLVFFSGSSFENGTTSPKRQKLSTIVWHFCIQATFQNKTFSPSCFGFLSGVWPHKSVIVGFTQELAKQKWTHETTKIGILIDHPPGSSWQSPVFTFSLFAEPRLCFILYFWWFLGYPCQTPLECCWRFKNRGLGARLDLREREF